MLELEGRIAVVTGGASGIGASCAIALREAGAIAVVWDVATGADVFCDAGDESSVAAALVETEARFGTPSLLIASAGVSLPGRIVDLPVERWDRTMSINLRGAFLGVQAIARRMIETGLDGSLLLVSSVNGGIADPGLSAYSASKAAVDHFARVAAVELGPHGIRVNSIAPGPTSTPMVAHLSTRPEWVEATSELTPLRRIGTPDLIAEAALNILRSEWITGLTVRADGGAALMTARGGMRAKGYPADAPESV
ncbi:MAG: SDR family oxidoreductase [Microbacterium sp.]